MLYIVLIVTGKVGAKLIIYRCTQVKQIIIVISKLLIINNGGI